MRLLDISIDLIHRIPVAERGGKYKRTRIVHHSGSIQGSFNQKFVDHSPRHVITDAYLRMDNQPYSRADWLKFTVCEDMTKE